jgi:hypothetical protein
MRIGYSPYTPSLIAPGDRRRFGAYARARGLRFELAKPGERYDLLVVSTGGDLASWSDPSSGADLVVFDLCDSYLGIPRGPTDTVRGLGKYALGDFGHPVFSFRQTVEDMCRRADAVICTTAEQQRTITRYNGNVHIALDMSDDSVRQTKSDYAVGDTLNIFWEGLPYNLRYFEVLREPLATLDRRRPVALHVMTLLEFGRWSRRIGTVHTKSLTRRLFPHTYVYEWNDLMLSRIATSCDLAVIPLDLTDPLAAGKSENKLLWMWKVGLPTLTTSTPPYVRAMQAAGVDMTCTTAADWSEKLTWLSDDENSRRQGGELGRAFATTMHDSETTLAEWDRAFESLGVRRAELST